MSRTLTLPTLETERLILRPPQLEDWPACEGFFTSERSRWVGGPVDGQWNAWKTFANLASGWMLRGYGVFVMLPRDSGRAIGAVGPWEPITWPEPEMSWSVWDADAVGKGYVTEAMTRILPWAFETLGWESCVSYIDRDNSRSAAVARRLGAEIDPDAPLPAWDDAGSIDVWRHRKGGLS